MGCSHDCSSCGSDCSTKNAESMIKPLNDKSSVKKVIGVVSGKGGVGKSLVTAMLAVNMANRGYYAAVLDADITGPSIPKAFGVYERVEADDDIIIPARTVKGIDIMSTNLILENDSDPVVWRGPIIAGAVEQFWTECLWDNVDYMFVDMPPGTGDAPLTVFQSLPVDGIIIVTSPQDLVTMIVGKAVKMAQMMDVPILAIVENMSYFKCPDCGKEYEIFGASHVASAAKEFQIPYYAKLPIDPNFAACVDKGEIEFLDVSPLDKIADVIEKI
ncbi:MAG: Mrp/NBP35 family ATP-binding protein [Clostridiales bacterium]|nr:Mrp/NBP35 family ATP-binding protein [Clostridiales bacterium]